MGWVEEPGNPAADCGTGSREKITEVITTAAILCHLDHITNRRGNSANQGGQGNKVTAGLPGARNQN